MKRLIGITNCCWHPVLWGEKDGIIPISNAQDYLDALPNARLATLPGLGHVPMEENPEQSLAPVQEFLNKK